MKNNKDNRVNHQFGPYINPDSEILILGSFPSVKSRLEAFYYMHPQNRFWKVLAEIFSDDFDNPDINIKKQLLLKHKIALYDVIDCCEIKGSQDSSITNVVPTDIKNLIKDTNINRILLNGKKAYNLFVIYNEELKDMGKYLPSSSPANAAFSLLRLVNEWTKEIF